MLRIGLCFDKKEFEYDIHSLLRAFYPGSQVTISYEEEESSTAGEEDLRFLIRSDHERILFGEETADGLKTVSCRLQGSEDRSERKNMLKQLVYRYVSEKTGRSLPWGDLTGIRPTKLAYKMMEQGLSNVQIAQKLRETYFTSPAKTALAVATVNREKAVLESFDYKKGYSLYIGIPFCPSICLYCSFGSHPLDRFLKMVEPYLDALFKELDFIADQMKEKPLQTIYIGGGTPTTLSAEQMDRLLTKVEEVFSLEHLREYTVECGRPDTITADKLQVIKAHRVGRISINPQTMNQKTLDLIGRKHTVEQICESMQLARQIGFENINMDLIVGLPGEGKEEVSETLRQIKELAPDSLTVHSLALKRATRLNLFREQYTPISFENSAEIMGLTERCAAEMGMGPYYLYRQKNMAGNFENVGYASLDKAGIYNILIMEERQTILAAGAGASTKFVFQNGERIERVENVKDLKNYIERIDEMLERKRRGIEAYLK